MNQQEPNESDQSQSSASDSVRQAFAALPLGEKVSTLLKVEWDLMGEVAGTIVDEASKALDEITDVIIGPRQSQTHESNQADQSAE